MRASFVFLAIIITAVYASPIGVNIEQVSSFAAME